jgi:hypothetical protein
MRSATGFQLDPLPSSWNIHKAASMSFSPFAADKSATCERECMVNGQRMVICTSLCWRTICFFHAISCANTHIVIICAACTQNPTAMAPVVRSVSLTKGPQSARVVVLKVDCVAVLARLLPFFCEHATNDRRFFAKNLCHGLHNDGLLLLGGLCAKEKRGQWK